MKNQLMFVKLTDNSYIIKINPVKQLKSVFFRNIKYNIKL